MYNRFRLPCRSVGAMRQSCIYTRAESLTRKSRGRREGSSRRISERRFLQLRNDPSQSTNRATSSRRPSGTRSETCGPDRGGRPSRQFESSVKRRGGCKASAVRRIPARDCQHNISDFWVRADLARVAVPVASDDNFGRNLSGETRAKCRLGISTTSTNTQKVQERCGGSTNLLESLQYRLHTEFCGNRTPHSADRGGCETEHDAL